MDPLKLIALDKDDIEIVSTHLQDAVVKIADIIWRPAEHRLVIGLNRFDWEACPHHRRSRRRNERGPRPCRRSPDLPLPSRHSGHAHPCSGAQGLTA